MSVFYFYDTQLGTMTIEETEGAVARLSLGRVEPPAGNAVEETALMRAALSQLTEYLEGKRRVFTIPLKPRGTAFQQRVWQALLEIPYGETRTYGEIAQRVGNPKACRAVGMANHRNPILILIPCHRVVGADGSLTGYGGGLPLKQRLLTLEKDHGPLCGTARWAIEGEAGRT